MNTSAPARTWALIRMDAARWVEPERIVPIERVTPSRVLKILAARPSFRATTWLRVAWMLRELGVKGVPSLIQQRLLVTFGLEMPVGATIGGGLYIAHPVGCVLVADVIGENVTVISAVTFGTRNDARWPTIGDRAFFGAGARVLGGIHVGDDARIGANATVLHDVPAGTTVVGVTKAAPG